MPSPHPGSLPDDVVDALRRGRKIEAIKRLREARGIGLKEAKEAVEDWTELRSPGAAAGRASRWNTLALHAPTLVVLAAIVWAFVNVVGPVGSVIVLLHRDGYRATAFTVEHLRHADDEDGLFWGFEGRVPEGPARLYAPELADARMLGYRGLLDRFPAGTTIPVWYNPAVTDTLFQARTLRLVLRRGDVAAPEFDTIAWWLEWCLAPLVLVMAVAHWRARHAASDGM